MKPLRFITSRAIYQAGEVCFVFNLVFAIIIVFRLCKVTKKFQDKANYFRFFSLFLVSPSKGRVPYSTFLFVIFVLYSSKINMEQIIQEPCCIENSLPRLLRQQPLCPWQTNGDVTFDKILKAVAYLAGNAITMLFVVPVVTHPMLHFIAWLWRRGWLSEVRILTTADQEAFIRQELPKELKATIANNAGVKEGFFRIDGEDGTVVTQGALLTAVTTRTLSVSHLCRT